MLHLLLLELVALGSVQVFDSPQGIEEVWRAASTETTSPFGVLSSPFKAPKTHGCLCSQQLFSSPAPKPGVACDCWSLG